MSSQSPSSSPVTTTTDTTDRFLLRLACCPAAIGAKMIEPGSQLSVCTITVPYFRFLIVTDSRLRILYVWPSVRSEVRRFWISSSAVRTYRTSYDTHQLNSSITFRSTRHMPLMDTILTPQPIEVVLEHKKRNRER